MRERPIQLAGALAAEERKLLACVEFALALLDSSSPAPLRSGDADLTTEDTKGFMEGKKESAVEAAGTDSSVDASAVAAPSKAKAADDAKGSAEASGSAAMLFEGCVTEGLFARVNRATARVLEAQGCRTIRPRGQVCCGALHAHAGDLEGARRLARVNVEAFENERDAPVVTNAGGCGAMLVS